MIFVKVVISIGRTVPTFRCVLELTVSEWREFRKALRAKDREAFDALMKKARSHASAASNAARSNPTEAMIMAILVEHEKELEKLKSNKKNGKGGELDEK